MEVFLDILVAVLLILGCLMSLIAGIGLLTFPDMLTRMHAATKPQVLGFLLIFIGLAIHLRSWAVIPVLALAWGMQLLTAPVSAHMIGRSGYRTKHAAKDSLYADELKLVVDKVSSMPATGVIEVPEEEKK
ncbi:monovalent cation/H(+) antiporter subunit G [Arthrobacter sp. NIO-1057]|uniref:monovalent cation/H(+) antiporter subunit G n=1 Tax=Arthrobacter sp. NIO-1057 TaxID=993071 RepID=UPI00071DA056|nr:monovalent cation/H(+) antiporter subunit G [Arthrobacter sp. NIO-1057]KSU64884.1 sodium:proton antiporter [Arthrobacter sp. NIO-1057]SCC49159.1 multisubunit sodium/proton antiporter, MrpG subunit (TC 2.A.63.1) [Arthrobacter sp. NIO-1057]